MQIPRGRSVAVLGTDDMSAFEMGVACEVFGTDRSDRGIPLWDFALCLPRRGPVRIRSGFTVASPHGPDRLATADLVIVPGWPHLAQRPPEPVLAALRAAVDRGAWLLGFCSGTFALAYAGLLLGSRFDQVERWMGPVSSAIVLGAVVAYFYRVFRIIRSRRTGNAA